MQNDNNYDPFDGQIIPINEKDIYLVEGYYFFKKELLSKLGKDNQLLDLLGDITDN